MKKVGVSMIDELCCILYYIDRILQFCVYAYSLQSAGNRHEDKALKKRTTVSNLWKEKKPRWWDKSTVWPYGGCCDDNDHDDNNNNNNNNGG